MTAVARRQAPAVLVGVIVTAIVVAIVGAETAVGDVGHLLAFACCVALSWVGVRRHATADRRPWLVVAVSVTLNLTGEALYAALGSPPGASLADALFIPAYALLGVTLVALLPRRAPGERDVDTLIDSLVAAVVGFALAWEVALDALVVGDGVSVATRFVSGVYPLIDIVVIALAVRVVCSRGLTRPILLVSIGSAVALAGDLVYAVEGEGVVTDAIAVLWMVALLLVSASTLPVSEARPPRSVDRARVWLVLAPVAIPVVLFLWGRARGDAPHPIVLLLAAIALLTLAGISCNRLLREVEEARAEVEQRERRFQALAVNSSDAVIVVDRDGVATRGGESLAHLLGVGEGSFDRPAAENPLVLDVDDVLRLLHRSLAAPGVTFRHEAGIRHPDGSDRWLELRVTNLYHDPLVDGVVVNVRDVTERTRFEREMRRRTLVDPLTGLANRAVLVDRVEQAFERAERTGQGFGLVLVTLDRFPALVDRLGPAAADEVLRRVADRLVAVVRPEDSVARIEADELAILVDRNHPDMGEAATVAARVGQALSVPFSIPGRMVKVTASIGLAVDDGQASAGEIWRAAGIARHQAQAAGGDQVVAYRPEAGSEAERWAILRTDLAHALAREELEVRFEPVFELATGRIAAVGGQLQWHHPELGIVPPAQLRALLDEPAPDHHVGRWLLETACTEAARWGAPGRPAPVLGVNLSMAHLVSDDLVDDVRRALVTSGLDPARLAVQVSESTLAAAEDAVTERLGELSELGVLLGVGGFGAGRSSLVRLDRLPIVGVKVDRSFTEAIREDGTAPPIVRGLLDLAGALGVVVIADGVERPGHRDGLLEAGFTLGQGPLLGAPVSAEEIVRLLETVDQVPFARVPSTRT